MTTRTGYIPNRQLPEIAPTPEHQPSSFTIHEEHKKLFPRIYNPDTERTESRIVRFDRYCITVTTVYGDCATFSKSNRSTTVTDSRTPKRRISIEEACSELTRLLTDPADISKAIGALNGH